ncbi:hypothetical protein FQR65_LT16290 [Abscondita terminalis]|nr:hypothetical protein FQR65_LT16290 [Abscondita terminalis]
MLQAMYSYNKGIPGAQGFNWYLGIGPTLGFVKGGDLQLAIRPMVGIFPILWVIYTELETLFIPAKLFKTKVEKFYLFFDPWFSLVKKKIGDTEYGIGWLPLGGYVKIAGMVDETVDFEYPSNIGNFEFGLKSTNTKSDNDIIWENLLNYVWTNDPSKSNHFIYKENINAGYATYDKALGDNWQITLGIRGEHTHSDGRLIGGRTELSEIIFNLFS